MVKIKYVPIYKNSRSLLLLMGGFVLFCALFRLKSRFHFYGQKQVKQAGVLL